MADVDREPALIRLNDESAAPKYMQIAEQVREFVATGSSEGRATGRRSIDRTMARIDPS